MRLPDHSVRSFVALPCPPGLREAIAAARPRWRAAGEGVRWTRPDSVHLTLRFLGNAGNLRLSSLDAELRRIADLAEPIRIEPTGTGAFPDWRRPRVLWLGLDGGAALLALAESVEEAARAAAFEPQERPFRPHLTLGRLKDERAADAEIEALRSWIPGTGREDVTEMILFRSDLEPGGPRHTALARYALGGEPWE